MTMREHKERLAARRTLEALLVKLRESGDDFTAPETVRESLEFVLKQVRVEKAPKSAS